MVEFVLLMWFVLSIAAGFWNHSRGNGFFTGLLISILLSPIIGFLVVIFTKSKKTKKKKK